MDGIHGQGSSSIDIDGLLSRYGNSLLANARRHSANAADADDAYQRALEILLTKAPEGLPEEQLVAWTHTVVRNEALQLHRRKRHEVDSTFDEISESWVADSALPDEKLLDSEHLQRGREALKRLNPDQTRCLLMRADGMGYEEICEITGFKYTKVNRLISDGRRAFQNEVVAIESGAACRRVTPMLSSYFDGEIGPDGRKDVASHIAGCLSCRASLREIGETDRTLSSLFPLAAAATAAQHGVFARAIDHAQSLFANLQERLFGHAATAQPGAEVVTAKKAALVVAATATVFAGGAAIQRAATPGHDVGARQSQSQTRSAAKAAQELHSRAARRSDGLESPRARKARSASTGDVIGSKGDRAASSSASQSAPETTENAAGFANEATDQIPAAADTHPAAGNDGGLSP